KLKPRAIKFIFLRYSDGVKEYILWRLDDVKPKIIISRDVVFNESLMYKDTLKGAGAADFRKEIKDDKHDEGPQQHNLDNYVLVPDRAKRITTIPARYRDEGKDTHKPFTFLEATNSSEKDEWVRAMDEEMISLKKNHTWELVDQPPGQKPEVFTSVVRRTSIRVILSLTACEDYELEQLDVKMAFLHGNLEETIYIRQPPGFEEGTDNQDMKELGIARKILEWIMASGSLCHWEHTSRPDIMYAVSIMSRYLANLGKHVDVDGFVDAVYAKDHDKEAEYMALTKAIKEIIWLKGLLIELGVNLGEIMEPKEIEVEKIGIEGNVGDAFTNVVPGLKFKYRMEILGVGTNYSYH
nr:hypothetical protein [Tanacetum cinerariifolium]